MQPKIKEKLQRYFDDAKYFEKKGDLVNAYGAVVYAHAFFIPKSLYNYIKSLEEYGTTKRRETRTDSKKIRKF